MRIAAYYRQSQDRTGEEYGVDRQRGDVERYRIGRDWDGTVVEFIDNDVSATKNKPRPAFEEMMARVDADEFDVIIARHMDRLLRKLSEFVMVRDRCRASDTILVTAADGVDTSTEGGRIVAGILAVVAEGEMMRKSERQISAVVQAVKQGRWLGGHRPFGYEPDGVTVRPNEAVIIRQGYMDVLAGETLTGITRHWNARSTTTRGKAWTRQSVRQVLTNPRNAGLRRHRPHADRGVKDPSLGVIGEAAWPGVVDVPTWNAAVRVLANPDRQWVRPETGLLSGIALCGVCRGHVGRGSTTRSGAPTYRCREKGCVSRQADPVDEAITEAVLDRLTQPDAAMLWSAERPDATALMAEASDLREELAAIDQDRADGLLDRTRWRTMNQRVSSRLSAIDEEISRFGDNSPLSIVASEDVRGTWASLTAARQRAIISALMTPVLHSPGAGARTFRSETVDPGWIK